jgi:GntR family transcriptional regulator
MSAFTVNLDHTSPIPLYHQLAGELESAIDRGDLSVGEQLGNEVHLAARWGVSRPTVRRAIQSLVDAGTLVRRRGVGTQVVNPTVRRPVKLSSLFDDLQEQGQGPKTELVRLATVKADRNVAIALRLEVGADVVYIERIRSAGRSPLAIMRNHLDAAIAGDITAKELGATGLYELLRIRGVRPRIATQSIGARVATKADTIPLGVRTGHPLLTMTRVMQDDLGRFVEYGNHAYNAERYSFETTVVDG